MKWPSCLLILTLGPHLAQAETPASPAAGEKPVEVPAPSPPEAASPAPTQPPAVAAPDAGAPAAPDAGPPATAPNAAPGLAAAFTPSAQPTTAPPASNAPPAAVPESQAVATSAEPTPSLARAPADEIRHHFRVGVAIVGNVAGGDPSETVSYGGTAGGGPALDLGFGVTSNVMLGLYGTLTWLDDGSNCPSCSALAAGGGAFVRYHLVQGLRIDPWIAYGAGVRSYEIQRPNETNSAFAIEWMRASVGADWNITRHTAVGTFLDLRLGTTTSTSGGDAGGMLYEGALGLRFAFDIPGR
jgi:hypothetical protein